MLQDMIDQLKRPISLLLKISWLPPTLSARRHENCSMVYWTRCLMYPKLDPPHHSASPVESPEKHCRSIQVNIFRKIPNKSEPTSSNIECVRNNSGTTRFVFQTKYCKTIFTICLGYHLWSNIVAVLIIILCYTIIAIKGNIRIISKAMEKKDINIWTYRKVDWIFSGYCAF